MAPASAVPLAAPADPAVVAVDSDAAAVLVLNAGSSSLKAALISATGALLWRDQWRWDVAAGPQEPGAPEAVLQAWFPALLDRCSGELAVIGHRVVHGGERFTAPTRLEESVLVALEELVPLAPLHNGPALRVMRWLSRSLSDRPQWACFDTAFHRTLPPAASTYALPAAWRARGLRRFGFHGLNHQHISEVVAALDGASAGRDPALGPLRLISCHLGAGCSLCAIRDGVSVATTMGYTPLEGLVMASRSGSVDPGLLLALLRQGLEPAELERTLNGASGLLGLSELSGSMEDLRQAAAAGHVGAALAIAVFHERLLQGIGAMAASLGGVDVIALSGGIGEHDRELQAALRRDLAWLEPYRL
ncbi:MAG: acetate/propionate family kinase, partial [Cyanobium sp.]